MRTVVFSILLRLAGWVMGWDHVAVHGDPVIGVTIGTQEACEEVMGAYMPVVCGELILEGWVTPSGFIVDPEAPIRSASSADVGNMLKIG